MSQILDELPKVLMRRHTQVLAPIFDSRFAVSVAARFGNTEGVKLILTKGVDVNEKNPAGQDALYCAALWGRSESIRALLAAGASATAKHLDIATAKHHENGIDTLYDEAVRQLTAAAK